VCKLTIFQPRVPQILDYGVKQLLTLIGLFTVLFQKKTFGPHLIPVKITPVVRQQLDGQIIDTNIVRDKS
jgi:hypothetical protein